jgi:hypothetical protein
MGWKSIKEAYRIEHLVHVTEAGICIGSPFIHDIIVISACRGEITKRYDPGRGWTRNQALDRYQTEMDADPFRLAALACAEDVFVRSIPVFTYDGGAVVEKHCEELGWPNVTHDGLLQYENTFSPDAGLVRVWAIDSARASIQMLWERIEEVERDLARIKARLAKRTADLQQLTTEALR